MEYILLANKIAIGIHGENDAIRYVKSELRDYIKSESQGIPIIGNMVNDDSLTIPLNLHLLLDGRLFYNENVFYIKSGGEYIVCKPQEKYFEIITSKGADGHALLGLLQALLNYYMPSMGLLFLHTAAFKYKNRIYAIHAFGGTGKTEVMLCALRNGADFISDDLAIYDSYGQIYPYTRSISLHDYPYTDDDLQFYGLSRRWYQIMRLVKDKKDRISQRLYSRLRGHYNIRFHYKRITCRETVLQFYPVDQNYWMETSDKTEFIEISNNAFFRKMEFCMQNEFRSYIDYDGYFGCILPFWNNLRNVHRDFLIKVLSKMDIEAININGQHYDEVFQLIKR